MIDRRRASKKLNELKPVKTFVRILRVVKGQVLSKRKFIIGPGSLVFFKKIIWF